MEKSLSMVRLDQVSKVYERGGDIITGLDRVTVEVAEGDFCAFIGPSGCGKSTLLNLVAGLDAPTSGSSFLKAGRPAGLRAMTGRGSGGTRSGSFSRPFI